MLICNLLQRYRQETTGLNVTALHACYTPIWGSYFVCSVIYYLLFTHSLYVKWQFISFSCKFLFRTLFIWCTFNIILWTVDYSLKHSLQDLHKVGIKSLKVPSRTCWYREHFLFLLHTSREDRNWQSTKKGDTKQLTPYLWKLCNDHTLNNGETAGEIMLNADWIPGADDIKRLTAPQPLKKLFIVRKWNFPSEVKYCFNVTDCWSKAFTVIFYPPSYWMKLKSIAFKHFIASEDPDILNSLGMF